MTIREILNFGTQKLESYTETPRLDSSILLSKAIGMDRATILANYQDLVDPEVENRFLNYIDLRVAGHPVAYILGEKEFYGYNFYLEEGVLTPRPDTEILVETAIELIKNHKLKTAIDMCTGTGCISITIKKECPDIDIIATDISPIAERVFKKNNQNLVDGAITFFHSNLFQNLSGMKFDMIVTNPPYLTKEETESRVNDGWKEPVLALDGGDDGLDLIREIVEDSVKFLNPNGWLLIEASPEQMPKIKYAMEKFGFLDIIISKDLAMFDRIIVGRYE